MRDVPVTFSPVPRRDNDVTRARRHALNDECDALIIARDSWRKKLIWINIPSRRWIGQNVAVSNAGATFSARARDSAAGSRAQGASATTCNRLAPFFFPPTPSRDLLLSDLWIDTRINITPGRQRVNGSSSICNSFIFPLRCRARFDKACVVNRVNHRPESKVTSHNSRERGD